jgi:CheY-like chemotaxis protein
MAQAKPWDVIVLDVQMPGLDGVALAQRLHTLLQPPPRLLALTGRSIAELGDSAAVFETVLRKPVDIEQFLRIVRRG